MKKNALFMAVVLSLFWLSGCGKGTGDADAVGSASDVAEDVETEEAEDEDSHYMGYSHYIDPEEAGKAAESETETPEDEQGDIPDETETAASETTEPAKEEVESAPASEAAAVQTPSAPPDKSQLVEWTPAINMIVLCDANVVDEYGNVLGTITKGCDIGVSGQCPGYYQVNYGAKRSFLPQSVLATH